MKAIQNLRMAIGGAGPVPGGYVSGEKAIRRETRKQLLALLLAIEDEEFQEAVVRNCRDKAHDNRWCPTCEAREAGIEDFRIALCAALEPGVES